jgi:hypothetical protein
MGYALYSLLFVVFEFAYNWVAHDLFPMFQVLLVIRMWIRTAILASMSFTRISLLSSNTTKIRFMGFQIAYELHIGV